MHCFSIHLVHVLSCFIPLRLFDLTCHMSSLISYFHVLWRSIVRSFRQVRWHFMLELLDVMILVLSRVNLFCHLCYIGTYKDCTSQAPLHLFNAFSFRNNFEWATSQLYFSFNGGMYQSVLFSSNGKCWGIYLKSMSKCPIFLDSGYMFTILWHLIWLYILLHKNNSAVFCLCSTYLCWPHPKP